MPEYRLYFLDRFTGHIEGAENFHASDDPAAVHRVQQHPRTQPLELWREGKKVARFDVPPDTAQPANHAATSATASARLTPNKASSSER